MGFVKLALAGVIGAAVPVLVACGSGGANLIPVANAGPLQGDFNAIADAVARGNCAATASALAKAQTDVTNLPATVDPRLRLRIQQGLADLQNTAPRECQANATSTQTTAPTNTQTTTTTQTTPTTTTPTTTTAPTTTTPPPTNTTPTTTGTGPLPDNGGGTPGPLGGGGGAGAGGAGAGGNP
jgi:cytoskeletal protein RodZ